MRVERISNVRVAQVMNNPVTERLNAVRQGLRQYGAVVLQDTPVDNEVINRLKKQFGDDKVTVEKSQSVRVTVEGFNK